MATAATSVALVASSTRRARRPRWTSCPTRCGASPFGGGEIPPAGGSAFGSATTKTSGSASPFGGAGSSSATDPFATGARRRPLSSVSVSSNDTARRADVDAALIQQPSFTLAGTRDRKPTNETSSPAQPSSSSSSSSTSVSYRAWDDVEVYEVPDDLRRAGSSRVEEHVTFYGLDELFPGSGLGETFNASAAFRTAIRAAMREDMFVPDPSKSDKINTAISSLGCSVMVNWKRSKSGYAALTKVFESNGVRGVTGEAFILALGGLCGTESHGSLIDITGTGRRKERHSWHQDSGLDRRTVMLGFPPSDGFDGVGVFSHAAKLSHPLRRADGDDAEGAVIQWEDFDAGELPVEVIGRPEYRPGHEVMVYCDATHVHSAPDETNRESVWRFM